MRRAVPQSEGEKKRGEKGGKRGYKVVLDT
jgi:hypothetical protein